MWNNSFKIPGYVEYYRDGYFNRTPHGGVGILVHQDIPHSRVNIRSTIQAVAVTVFMEQRITICSVYCSGRHVLTTQSLKLLFEQLPAPILMLGDLNGQNQMWGSVQTDRRGQIIEEAINQCNFDILNNGEPTRITDQSSTAIDISVCSP